MRRLLLSVLLVSSSWIVLPVSAVAQEYYVNDEVQVILHRGPSREYKIKAWVTAGTPFTILARNESTGFLQVRMKDGTVGWLDKKHLKEGQSIADRMPKVEAELASTKKQLAAERSQVAALQKELNVVKQSATDKVAAVNDARAKSTAQVAQLQNEIERLEGEIAAVDQTNMMGWLVRGGLIALGGVILGIIIPRLPKRRRRQEEWF